MDWSPQQAGALDAVGAWLKDTSPDKPQVFKLMGYAGTGKTTLAKHLVQDVPRHHFAAYTGKAAHVLRKKGCHGASTIHQLIYRPVISDNGEVTFELNNDSLLIGSKLLVVDEVSMVNREIGEDLLSFEVPILVLGDPAQLPPVKGTGFFTEGEPDVLLTEIHRQATDNPIIHLATEVRKGNRLKHGDYGSSKIVPKLGDERLAIEADQILVGKNVTRREFNERARVLLDRSTQNVKNLEHIPVVGDKLVCLRNNHQKGFLNGSIWYVDRAFGVPKDPELAKHSGYPQTMHLKVYGEDDIEKKYRIGADVWTHYFIGEGGEAPWSREKVCFDFGYALTVHKAQGSEWDNVVIFDESRVFRDDASKWLYTAITRAADRLTLVSFRP